MGNLKKLMFLLIFMSVSLFADEIKELNVFTLYKYKADYNKLTKEQQSKINEEYKNLQKFSKKVEVEVKDSPLYKAKKHLSIFETWTIEFMNNYKPKENELKNIYENNDFKTNPEYKLKTIILKNEKRAQSIIKQLIDRKGKEKRIKLFDYFVKKDSIDKNGDLGWIDFARLNPNIKKNIVNFKANDILKVKNNDIIQILYIEDFKKSRKASYEESMPLLINMAKKEALNVEIKRVIQ